MRPLKNQFFFTVHSQRYFSKWGSWSACVGMDGEGLIKCRFPGSATGQVWQPVWG